MLKTAAIGAEKACSAMHGDWCELHVCFPCLHVTSWPLNASQYLFFFFPFSTTVQGSLSQLETPTHTHAGWGGRQVVLPHVAARA